MPETPGGLGVAVGSLAQAISLVPPPPGLDCVPSPPGLPAHCRGDETSLWRDDRLKLAPPQREYLGTLRMLSEALGELNSQSPLGDISVDLDLALVSKWAGFCAGASRYFGAEGARK